VATIEVYLGGCYGRRDASIQFEGTYTLSEPAPESVQYQDLNTTVSAFLNVTYTAKPLYLYTTQAVAILELVCFDLYVAAGYPKPNATYPIQALAVGCPLLGVGSCIHEFDIVQVDLEQQTLATGI
jgi:hypothetical protein